MKSTPFTLETLHPTARRLYDALAILDSNTSGMKGHPLSAIMSVAGEADTQDCQYRAAQLISDDFIACDGGVYESETVFWVVK